MWVSDRLSCKPAMEWCLPPKIMWILIIKRT
jgi:hypothetical protein